MPRVDVLLLKRRLPQSSLLLLLGALDEEVVGLVHLGSEVVGICEELLEVDDLFVEEHTGKSWSELFTDCHLDDSVDVVTDEVALLLSGSEGLECGHVNLRQLEEWLLWSSLRSLTLSWWLLAWSWRLWHSGHTWLLLIHPLFVIAILLLLRLIAVLLLWVLLIRLVTIPVMATSVLTSVTTSVSSSTSVVISVSHLILVVVLTLTINHHITLIT